MQCNRCMQAALPPTLMGAAEQKPGLSFAIIPPFQQ